MATANIQLLTVAFAIALAGLNKWPVMLMRQHWAQGVHKAKERQFHFYNAGAKVLWAVGMAFSEPISWFDRGLIGLLLLLILWLVFDPALNLFTGKPPFYLGKTAALDRLVKHGAIKAAACLALIIILNFIL